MQSNAKAELQAMEAAGISSGGKRLIWCPASDCNYRPMLGRATEEDIHAALNFMRGRDGHKARIAVCERELKKRRKEC